MIPKRVLLENFLSFGEPAVVIEFADNEPLWVICGPNGVGKSAIFDAVTYALFASHRGGVKNAEQLIRHGASGFRVEFDFEINGRDFRITRTKAARTTQRVYSRIPNTDEWVPEHIGNTAPDVKRWVEKNIGMEFEAFKASVLLRQGEADAILTATGSERLALLKTIIGANRFEFISDRIHDDLKEFKDELDRLRQTLDNAPLVSDDEITAAHITLTQTEQRRKVAQERRARSIELLAGAKQWMVLRIRKASLEESMTAANERAVRAAQLRKDKDRLDLLTMVVPKLRTILDLQNRIHHAETDLEMLNQQKSELTTRREAGLKSVEAARQKADGYRSKADEHEHAAKQLRDEITRDTKSLSIAEELTTLNSELSAFPADLSQKLDLAESDLLNAISAAQNAGEARAATLGLLKLAEARQSEFSRVGVDSPCSLCGQMVDKFHAEKEKAFLAKQVRDLQIKLQIDEKSVVDAVTTKQACKAERDQLAEMDQRRKMVVEKLQTIKQFGISSEASELRRQIDTKSKSATENERRCDDGRRMQKAAEVERKQIEHECRGIEESLATLTTRTRALETANAGDISQRTTLIDQLPPDWQGRAQSLESKLNDDLETEKKRLEGLGISKAFEEMQQDSARMKEWMKQLNDTIAEMAEIPSGSQIPIEEVEGQNREAATEADAADQARDEAKEHADDLNRRLKNQRELANVIRTAERKLDLQKKLDELFGKKGLQRELVRAAERDIVAYAKDTVDNLSDGDLTLELAEDQDADTAFDLRVLRAEDPTPIGVSFLSGSQKFRVAVSIALAIGRFASGQARPLESVIIDEGFGSLDREGLRSMADELNRLRTFLRRIVLVSHQEEFADRFPVGIRLSASEHGTVAVPFRR